MSSEEVTRGMSRAASGMSKCGDSREKRSAGGEEGERRLNKKKVLGTTRAFIQPKINPPDSAVNLLIVSVAVVCSSSSIPLSASYRPSRIVVLAVLAVGLDTPWAIHSRAIHPCSPCLLLVSMHLLLLSLLFCLG